MDIFLLPLTLRGTIVLILTQHSRIIYFYLNKFKKARTKTSAVRARLFCPVSCINAKSVCLCVFGPQTLAACDCKPEGQ